MLPACWKNNRLEKSVVLIITKNSHQKWLVVRIWLVHQKNFHLGSFQETESGNDHVHFLLGVKMGDVFQGFVGPMAFPLPKCWLPVHLDTIQTSVCKSLNFSFSDVWTRSKKKKSNLI
jgi:hypothetical protein